MYKPEKQPLSKRAYQRRLAYAVAAVYIAAFIMLIAIFVLKIK